MQTYRKRSSGSGEAEIGVFGVLAVFLSCSGQREDKGLGRSDAR